MVWNRKERKSCALKVVFFFSFDLFETEGNCSLHEFMHTQSYGVETLISEPNVNH